VHTSCTLPNLRGNGRGRVSTVLGTYQGSGCPARPYHCSTWGGDLLRGTFHTLFCAKSE
jgi:hypothetical protein